MIEIQWGQMTFYYSDKASKEYIEHREQMLKEGWEVISEGETVGALNGIENSYIVQYEKSID